MIPSFLFAGMDAHTKRLAEELESLGGGDAKAAHLQLHAIIDDTIVTSQPFSAATGCKKSTAAVPTKRSQLSQILWPLGKSVGLRDIKKPGATPIADSMQYYATTSASRVSSVDQKRHSLYHPESDAIAKWIQNGFNATVVNYGPTESMKMTTLFGPQVSASSLQHPQEEEAEGKKKRKKTSFPTLVSEVLGKLFQAPLGGDLPHHIPSVPLPTPGVIAISMWYLQNNNVVDVCASSSSSSSSSSSDESLEKEWLQFVSIECPDYDTAMKVIQTGRSRCPQSQHHLFLRVLLYRPNRANVSSTDFSSASNMFEDKGSLSHLHLVDLVGASSPDSLNHRNASDEESRISRRDHWLQLNSLWQVMKEMADLSRKSDPAKSGSVPSHPAGGEGAILTSARSSKLTVLLAPLLQGNTKTWFFVHLLDGEEHFQQSAHTLRHIEGMEDIVTACYRVKDVSLVSLDLRRPDTVLLPVFDRPFSAAPTIPSPNDDEAPPSQSQRTQLQSFFTNFIKQEDVIPPSEEPLSHHVLEQTDQLEHSEDINLHSLASSNMYQDTNFDSMQNDGNNHYHNFLDEGEDRDKETIRPLHAVEETKELQGSAKTTTTTNEGSSEYSQLMNEFNAVMEQVSSTENVPQPTSLQEPTLVSHEVISEEGLHASISRVLSAGQQNKYAHLVSNSFGDGQHSSASGHSSHDAHVTQVTRRHAAHGSQSSDSYTQSYDDHISDDDRCVDDEDLWDSLDEDDGSSSHYDRETQPDNRSIVTSSTNSSRNLSTSKALSHIPHSSKYVSEKVTNQDRAHAISNTIDESSKYAQSSSQKGATSSFYNWAATSSTTLPAQLHPPASPQREIDVTHQELLETIEHQKKEQELTQMHRASVRFPYYETVHAIETESPHSYRGDPQFERSEFSPSTRVSVVEEEPEGDEISVNDDVHCEVSRLEHVNNSLLLALQQEKHERSLLDKKILLIQDEILETRTQHEVVIDSHKIEVLRLKGHIRRLSQECGFEETLQAFEEDFSRVLKEKDLLKKRFTQVEEKLFLVGHAVDDEVTDNLPNDSDEKENKSFSRLNASSSSSTSIMNLSVAWTAGGIVSAGGEETVSAKEFRTLKHKYKRAERSRDEYATAYEDLKKKERRYVLSTKHSDETARRLKLLHSAHEQTKEQLNEALHNLQLKTNEVELLKQEAVALQQAERSVRADRSNIVHELSVARHRLREFETERKNQRYANRFISKHGYGGGGSDHSVKTSKESHHVTPTPSEQQQRIRNNNQAYFDLLGNTNSEVQYLVPLPNEEPLSDEVVTGIAGPPDAMYLRGEEVETMSVKLEQALLDLRDAITLNAPSLLPLVHTLNSELRQERTTSHQQKVSLVMKLSGQRRQLPRSAKKSKENRSENAASTNNSNISAAMQSIGGTLRSSEKKVGGRRSRGPDASTVLSNSSGSIHERLMASSFKATEPTEPKHLSPSHSSLHHTPSRKQYFSQEGLSHHLTSHSQSQQHTDFPNHFHQDIAGPISTSSSNMMYEEASSLMGTSKGGRKPNMVFFRRLDDA